MSNFLSDPSLCLAPFSVASFFPLYFRLIFLAYFLPLPSLPPSVPSYILAPFSWLTVCLSPVSCAFSSFLYSRPILLAYFWPLSSFFRPLLPFIVSSKFLGLLFASLQFLSHSSTSYSLAPFSWLTFCLSLFHFFQPIIVFSRFLTFCLSSVSFDFSSSSALCSFFFALFYLL